MSIDSATRRTLRAGVLPGLLEAAVDGGPSVPGSTRRTVRDILVDGLCVLLAAAMGLVGVMAPPGGSLTAGGTVVSIVAGVLACASLLVRRRYAVFLAAVLIVTSVWLPVVSGASLIALFTAAVHRRLPIVLTLVALAAASAVAQLSVSGWESGSSYWLVIAATMVITLLVVGWGVAVRVRREVVLMMADRLRRLESEQEAIVHQARQNLKEAIARDMHDSLAHRLSLISMSAGALQYRGSLPPSDLADMVDIVRSNAQLALGELREVVTELRAPDDGTDHERPLSLDVTDLVNQARSAGQQVELRWNLPRHLPPRLSESMVRVVQEGLSNARKHAPDAAVTVSGNQEPYGLVVELTNGYGPAPARSAEEPTGLGLRGMSERVERLGGQVTSVRDDTVFRLHVWWPSRADGGDR